MAIRILITDDHGVIRAGLRALLENVPEIAVVGEAATGEEAIRFVGEKTPDIVLMDIGLQGMDGIETTRQIKRIYPQVDVLILSVYEDGSLLQSALQAGASGYIIKRSAAEELVAAIQAVSRGDMYIHPAVTRLLVKNFSAGPAPAKGALQALTHREVEIMRYIIRGFTNRQIAETLCISTRTVEGHRASIFGKLDLKNRVELVEYAEKNGLID
jgi:two-component system response regulator NreC